MINSIKYCLLLLAVVLLAGCAATAAKNQPALLYPPLPDEPKIAFVRSIKGEVDFRKPGFFDAFFGAPSGSDFKKPYGVSAAGDSFFVADGPSTVVFAFDTKLEKVRLVGFSGQGKLTSPIGVAATSDGSLYVTDGPQKKVFVYGPDGGFRFSFGKQGEFKNIAGIAVNEKLGLVYVVDAYGHCVHVYSLKGEPRFQFGKDGSGDGDFHYPTNVAINRKTDNVYIVDTQNFRVEIFDKDGKFLKKFGELGDQPGTFARPKGIGIDSEGHVYVADAAFNNFQIFDQDGRILLSVGDAGSENGMFVLPAGLYVDEKDRIYVVDSMNERVQIFQYLSENWKRDHPEEYKKMLASGNEQTQPENSSGTK